jgi:hypothetical protein
MTANTSIDPAVFLHEQLAQASPDLMRELSGNGNHEPRKAPPGDIHGSHSMVRLGASIRSSRVRGK